VDLPPGRYAREGSPPDSPAFVIGPRWDIEAFNAVADRVYRFRDHSGVFSRNHIWRFFMDDERRKLYLDWDALAESAVGLLRVSYARLAGDDYVERLVEDLIGGSARFREIWNAQRTAAMAPDDTRLLIPEVGEVLVTSVRLPLPDREDHVLFLLPPADERSADRVADLIARLPQSEADPRSAPSRRPHGRRPRRRMRQR
jgi:hypothetical protein